MDRLGGSLPDVVLWPGYTGSLADVVLWPGLKDVVVDGSETRLSRQDQIVLSLFQVDWHSRHSLFRIPYHFSSLLLFAMVFLSLFLSEIWLKECMEDFQTVTDLFLRCFVMVVILLWRNELRVQGLNHCIQPFVPREISLSGNLEIFCSAIKLFPQIWRWKLGIYLLCTQEPNVSIAVDWWYLRLQSMLSENCQPERPLRYFEKVGRYIGYCQ